MSSNNPIVITEDGSSTLISSVFGERYHSIHGAQTESQVVFIDAGLKHFALSNEAIKVLEMGFGTGLNALMSWDYADSNKVQVEYTGYEKFPITTSVAEKLNYGSLYKSKDHFLRIHSISESETHKLSPYYKHTVYHKDIKDLTSEEEYHVIFFDAFAPAAQEELWTTEMFTLLYKSLKPGGILVTYCAKGQVKRNMKSVGFKVIGLPGPPGKREMTKALKV